jgi:hypothetical protein
LFSVYLVVSVLPRSLPHSPTPTPSLPPSPSPGLEDDSSAYVDVDISSGDSPKVIFNGNTYTVKWRVRPSGEEEGDNTAV